MAAFKGRTTKFREAFKVWEAEIGQAFLQHTPGQPNYLRLAAKKAKARARGDNENLVPLQPFPLNKNFTSQPVLSSELKEELWMAVVQNGKSLRNASVTYRMDIRRVAAVVRLKQIEKQWIADGKKLASVYDKAVMGMLPQTPLQNPAKVHEPINDLMVHPSTMRQVFWPVAESQTFTRVEAGEAFGDGILPAEVRIPHPQLYAIAKRANEGNLHNAVEKEEWDKIDKTDGEAKAKLIDRIKDREARTTTVQTPRWAFKFEDVMVDAKSTGRFSKGIGARYGIPHEDRKKGQVKIPTQVIG